MTSSSFSSSGMISAVGVCCLEPRFWRLAGNKGAGTLFSRIFLLGRRLRTTGSALAAVWALVRRAIA